MSSSREAAAPNLRSHALGVTFTDRLWRRMTGAGAATGTLAFGFGLVAALEPPTGAASHALPAAVLRLLAGIEGAAASVELALPLVYGYGLAASFVVELALRGRASRARVPAYAAAGAVPALVPGTGPHPVTALVMVMGAVVAAAGATLGLRLRGRMAHGVAWGVPLALLLGYATMVFETPGPPGDSLTLVATDEAVAEFGDARGLALAVADGFTDEGEGRERLGHATWVAVSYRITDRDLGDAQPRVAYEPGPTKLEDGTPARRVTVGLGSERACAEVTAQSTTTHPAPCREHPAPLRWLPLLDRRTPG